VSEIYKTDEAKLHELITRASSSNASILIPELQRPYVWNPRQVITLVDSILRGWPFGSLLMWNLGDIQPGAEMFPNRAFWKIFPGIEVPEGEGKVGDRATTGGIWMVLDGQQRLQSLILALSAAEAGMKLPDTDWRESIENRRIRGRAATQHWQQGELYLDLDKFKEQTSGKYVKDTAEYSDCLVWACRDNHPGTKSTASKQPLVSVGKQHLRLSSLWDLAITTPSGVNLETKIHNLLDSHSEPNVDRKYLLEPLQNLIDRRIKPAKDQVVQFLLLEPLESSGYHRPGEESSQNGLDPYNVAIVNIFTRLNQGGRSLTKEEITFAWIKIAWNTEGAAAIEKLCDDLNLIDRNFKLKADDVVRMLSIIWSAADEQRVKGPLQDNELIPGIEVQKMAGWLRDNWHLVDSGFTTTAKIVFDNKLEYQTHYQSLNALSLLAAWRVARDISLKKANATLNIHQENGDNVLDAWVQPWMTLSHWAGVWGERTNEKVAERVKELKLVSKILSTNPVAINKEFESLLKKWVVDLTTEAKQYIANLSADRRSDVRRYYSALDLWNSLVPQRRAQADKAVLSKHSASSEKVEVDHIVSYKLAERVSNDDRFKNFSSANELLDLINSCGNCALLKKNFNISRSDTPLWVFLTTKLKQINDFQPEDYARELGIDISMSKFGTIDVIEDNKTFSKIDFESITESDIAACVQAIKMRDKLVKKELLEKIDQWVNFAST